MSDVSTTLWGRDDEVAVLERFVGTPGTAACGVLVVGEPGIGKSSLWARGVTAARAAGLRVLATTSVEAESEMPYVGLEDLFADLLDEREPVLPEVQRDALDAAFRRRDTGTTPDPRTVAAGVLSLLRDALDAGPVVLAVDDLHWTDPETFGCLGYAARRLADRPLVLLWVARDHSPLWQPRPERSADGLARMLPGGIETLRLGPLPGRTIGRILHERRGIALSSTQSRRLAADTGGNPFWALQFAPGQAGPDHLVDGLIADRIGSLDHDVVEASCLVAALGRPRAGTVLSAVRSSDSSGEQVLDSAITAGLLTVAGARVTTSHPLIGTALLSSLPPFRRRRLHRRAADLAESAEARALQLLHAVADEPDTESTARHRDELLAALDTAAVAARHRGAPGSAARFVARAVALVEHDEDARSAERRVTWAELHHQAGEPDEVLTVLDRLDLTDLAPGLLERAALLLAQTSNDRRGDRAARAVADVVDALPRVGLSPDALAQRRALVSTLQADMQCGAIGDRRERARRAVEQTRASPVGVPLRRRALAALVYALTHAGSPTDDAVEQLAALGTPDPVENIDARDIDFTRGTSRWSAGDLTGAAEHFTTTFERHLVVGDEPAIAIAGDALAYVQVLAGLPAAAEQTLARLDEHTGWRPADVPYIVNGRGFLHLVRGEQESLEELLDGLDLSGYQPGRRLGVGCLRGLLALQRDDPARAVTEFDRFVAVAEKAGIYDPLRRLDADVPLAEALIATGEHERAARAVDVLDEFARRTGREVTRGQHQRVLAVLVARRDQDLDRALDLARTASELLAGTQFPGEHAHAMVTLARIHELRDEPDAATGQRRDAHALFTTIGYRARAQKVADDLDPATSVLSPSERTVVDLVAGGATNREAASALHLSVRTVENHLASAYRKLGVRSRTELARRLTRRPSAGP